MLRKALAISATGVVACQAATWTPWEFIGSYTPATISFSLKSCTSDQVMNGWSSFRTHNDEAKPGAKLSYELVYQKCDGGTGVEGETMDLGRVGTDASPSQWFLGWKVLEIRNVQLKEPPSDSRSRIPQIDSSRSTARSRQGKTDGLDSSSTSGIGRVAPAKGRSDRSGGSPITADSQDVGRADGASPRVSPAQALAARSQGQEDASREMQGRQARALDAMGKSVEAEDGKEDEPKGLSIRFGFDPGVGYVNHPIFLNYAAEGTNAAVSKVKDGGGYGASLDIATDVVYGKNGAAGFFFQGDFGMDGTGIACDFGGGLNLELGFEGLHAILDAGVGRSILSVSDDLSRYGYGSADVTDVWWGPGIRIGSLHRLSLSVLYLFEYEDFIFAHLDGENADPIRKLQVSFCAFGFELRGDVGFSVPALPKPEYSYAKSTGTAFSLFVVKDFNFFHSYDE